MNFLLQLSRRSAPLFAVVLGVLISGVAVRAAGLPFSPNLNGNVYATLVQADGRIVIGGNFTVTHPNYLGAPTVRLRLARFLADGTLDAAFDPDFSGPVTSLAMDSDGRILVGGSFTEVTSNGVTYLRRGIARLNADGAVDETFSPQFFGGSTAQPAVSAIAVQEDGHLLVGGAFLSAQSSNSDTTLSRLRLARLDAAGVIDPDFAPQANNTIFAVAVQPDGAFLVGGGFTKFNAIDGAAATRTRIARFLADGSLDTAFDVAADNRVRAFALEADGSIIVAGDFLALRGSDETELQDQLFVARLDTAGRRDPDFHPRPNAAVSVLAVQHNGRILVGGNFARLDPVLNTGGYYRNNFARLLRSGDVDPDFLGGADSEVAAIALQPDGRIVVGGYFVSISNTSTGTSGVRVGAARLLADGALETDLTPTVGGSLYATAEQADGSILIGGSFGNVAGVTRHNLARLKSDGTLDPTFAPVLDGLVRTIAVQSDGKIVIGGSFLYIDEEAQPYFARLNADGTRDASFDPQPNGSVYAVIPESDGSFTVGGAFTQFSPNYDVDTSADDYKATTRSYLARVNGDGSIGSWNPTAGGAVYALVRESSGTLLVGGSFAALGGGAVNYLGRLKTNDKLDGSFNPEPNSSVAAIAVQSDGSIVFGGDFSLLNQDDGEGDDDDEDELFNDDADRSRLARVKADGTLDRTFKSHFNAHVGGIQILADGKILVGGAFTQFTATTTDDAISQAGIIRLNADGSRDTTFDWSTNSAVTALLPMKDGGFWVVGGFSAVYSTSGESIGAEQNIVRYTSAGEIDTAWSVKAAANTSAYVSALSVQRNGSIVVGGSFDSLSGSSHRNLLRLGNDGRVDGTLYDDTDGPVRALLTRSATGLWSNQQSSAAWLEASGRDRTGFDLETVSRLDGVIYVAVPEADGSILLGGSFEDSSDSTYSNLVRLRTDGTLDPDFHPQPDASVSSLKVQPDGKILVVGPFTTISGEAQAYAARLNTDGSLDTGFRPVPASTVSVVEYLSSGKVLIGGSFRIFNVDDGEKDDDDGDELTDDDTLHPYLARLNSDGTLDTTFDVIPNSTVTAILVEADGSITFSGGFTSVTDNKDVAFARSYVARVTADGVMNENFNPTPNGQVSVLVRQPDGKLIMGGAFTLLQLSDGENDDDDGDESTTDDDADCAYLARLNADDTLDTTFQPDPNSSVTRVALQSDGRIIVLGNFNAFYPHDEEEPIRRVYMARLESDGSIDETFNPNPNGLVKAMVVADDDSIFVAGYFTKLDSESLLYLGGEFSTVGTASLPYFARMHPSGIADGAFKSEADGRVLALAAQRNGRLLVGGAFSHLFGQSRARVARLYGDGTLDTTYAPVFDGEVRAFGLRADDTLVVGGTFTQVNGLARAGLARLTPAGAVDAGFAPAIEGQIDAVVQQSDGRVVIAGNFTAVNGVARPYLARLNVDGTTDTTFAPAPDGLVSSVSLRADGALVVGGAFSSIGGGARAKLAVLGSTGSLVDDWSGTIDGDVLAAVIDRDGSVLAGGYFGTFLGSARYRVGRAVAATTPGDSVTVATGGTSFSWLRTGGSAELSSVDVSLSLDGSTWEPLGVMIRPLGSTAWSLPSAGLPVDSNYSLRLRGVVGGTTHSSSSVVEVYWNFSGTVPSGYGYPDTLPLSWNGRDTASDGDGSGGDGSDGDGSSGGDGSGDGGSSGGGVVDVLGSRFVDISCRLNLTGSQALTLGFVITGEENRQVLLRAVGPGLAPFGVNSTMTAPRLTLQSADGTQIVSATGWNGSSILTAVMSRVGAFALDVGSADAAIAPVLAPGAYTLTVADDVGVGGVILAEVYDAGAVDSITRLANISSLGTGGSGDATFIAGFVIAGDTTRRVLIRGVGPGLVSYGVTDALTDPSIKLYNAAGDVIGQNDNWGSGTSASNLVTTASTVGAFALSDGSADAALLVDLPPGAYTVQISGKADEVGRGLIEVYDVR